MFSTSTKQNTKHAANKTVRRILSWIGMKKMHHRVHKLVLVLTSVWQKYSYFEFFFLCFNFSKFYTTSMFYLCKKKVKWYLGGLWTCWSSSSRTLDFLCASLFTVSMPSCWNQRCFFSPLPLSKVWKGRTFWCNMRAAISRPWKRNECLEYIYEKDKQASWLRKLWTFSSCLSQINLIFLRVSWFLDCG